LFNQYNSYDITYVFELRNYIINLTNQVIFGTKYEIHVYAYFEMHYWYICMSLDSVESL